METKEYTLLGKHTVKSGRVFEKGDVITLTTAQADSLVNKIKPVGNYDVDNNSSDKYKVEALIDANNALTLTNKTLTAKNRELVKANKLLLNQTKEL